MHSRTPGTRTLVRAVLVLRVEDDLPQTVAGKSESWLRENGERIVKKHKPLMNAVFREDGANGAMDFHDSASLRSCWRWRFVRLILAQLEMRSYRLFKRHLPSVAPVVASRPARPRPRRVRESCSGVAVLSAPALQRRRAGRDPPAAAGRPEEDERTGAMPYWPQAAKSLAAISRFSPMGLAVDHTHPLLGVLMIAMKSQDPFARLKTLTEVNAVLRASTLAGMT